MRMNEFQKFLNFILFCKERHARESQKYHRGVLSEKVSSTFHINYFYKLYEMK